MCRDQQEQQNNNNNEEKKIQDNSEILHSGYSQSHSDQQEQENSNNNGEMKIQEDSEAIKRQANLVVSKDGKGKGGFTTIKQAVNAAPDNNETRFIIYVKEGIYDEIVHISGTKTNIPIIGDERDKTVITGNLNVADGVQTFDSATLAVDGAGFIGRSFCIRNTVGPEKMQVVALRVSADKAALYLCGIEGYQDTLYAHLYRQFYRDCYISGTVDFICGDASAVFQKCQIVAKKPLTGQWNMITAQQRQNNNTGFSFQQCTITASADLVPIKATIKTYLGRPWADFSTVAFMNCDMDDVIDSLGWHDWENSIGRESTVCYREYQNRCLGAVTSGRVKWGGFKVITDPKDAEEFTVRKLLNPDSWLNLTGVP